MSLHLAVEDGLFHCKGAEYFVVVEETGAMKVVKFGKEDVSHGVTSTAHK